ncbi:hypothetical protein [Bifidobacterium felsineum]|uniref:hypothetical protein n=1 Tax=Bifidobacterium felsineum TaxID=2045440 RepID=UPI001BDD74CB|nr:hypothetical protein [Bifidobacterium felsineum]MBT1164833.1 hypothetical protein [Bifidobacterium felsineum]
MDRKRAIKEKVRDEESGGSYVSTDFTRDMQRCIDGKLTIGQMMERAWRNDHRQRTDDPADTGMG